MKNHPKGTLLSRAVCPHRGLALQKDEVPHPCCPPGLQAHRGWPPPTYFFITRKSVRPWPKPSG